MNGATHIVDMYGDLMPTEGMRVECEFDDDGECACGRREGQPTDDEQERADLMEKVQAAQDAAYGDSNDTEIDLLREALEQALGMLGLELPDGREPE